MATELTVENLLWTIKFLGYLNRTEQLLHPNSFGGGTLYCFDPEFPLGGFYNHEMRSSEYGGNRSAYLPHDYTFDNLRENVAELKTIYPNGTDYIQEIEDWLEENQSE